MKRLRKILSITAVATGVLGAPLVAGAEQAPYAHVLLISIDGMHSIDLTNFLNNSAHLASTLKTLSNNTPSSTRMRIPRRPPTHFRG
jgi:hypothetical protein